MTSIPDTAGEILIALGANIASPAGPPLSTLKAALNALENRGVSIQRVSAFYETPAWPDAGDPPFVNAVCTVLTNLQPLALMTLLHDVETSLGRKRSAPNAPRSLDLDLLDYRGKILDGGLCLPHPRLATRRFVLEPLAGLSPGWRHPLLGRTAAELLESLK